MGQSNGKVDARTYRHGYPGKASDPHANENLRFYRNEMPSRPQGALIDTIHEQWWGRYGLLEEHHSYIQWLFPIREHGVNMSAQPLELHEAQAIASDPVLRARLIKSYRMMLDFFGFQLVDETTGEVRRAEQFRPQFRNLNMSSHNYLRITRILKCLGECGLEHLKVPWLEALITECFETGELEEVSGSLKNFWILVVKSRAERHRLAERIRSYKHKVESDSESIDKEGDGGRDGNDDDGYGYDDDDDDPYAYKRRGVPGGSKGPGSRRAVGGGAGSSAGAGAGAGATSGSAVGHVNDEDRDLDEWARDYFADRRAQARAAADVVGPGAVRRRDSDDDDDDDDVDSDSDDPHPDDGEQRPAWADVPAADVKASEPCDLSANTAAADGGAAEPPAAKPE